VAGKLLTDGRFGEIKDIKMKCDNCKEEILLHRQHSRSWSRGWDAPNGHRGAMGEFLVCIDLISEGWHAFRSATPAAPFDLVAYKGEHLLKVEVKIANKKWREDDSHYIRHGVTSGKHDILALVLPDSTIEYRPELPSENTPPKGG